jgi:predicted membrane protein
MRISRRERGEGNLGCIFGLILIVLALFVAFKMIPVKVKNAEIRQVIVDEGKSAGTHNDEKIRQVILAKAVEDNLPITLDDIKVHRGNNEITIDVEYTMPINFPGYTYQWHIAHHVNNPIF